MDRPRRIASVAFSAGSFRCSMSKCRVSRWSVEKLTHPSFLRRCALSGWRDVPGRGTPRACNPEPGEQNMAWFGSVQQLRNHGSLLRHYVCVRPFRRNGRDIPPVRPTGWASTRATPWASATWRRGSRPARLLYYTIPHHTISCYILCYTILHYTMLYHTIL